MSEVAVQDLRQRREMTGLSKNLLDHAETGQNFLGFISYRRSDGLAVARWLRDRITNFRPPLELKEKIEAYDAKVGGKQNRVFFDMSYQKPNVDFWDEHIAASLCRSQTLILLQSPSLFERLDDGGANWCEREIETYLKYYGDPSRILVVMAPNAPIDRFPEPLEQISARWDWIDLRFFSESAFTRFRHGKQYDPLLAKILAKIYDISDGDLPLLNQEFAKGRARIRRALTVAAGAAFISLSGLTAWALTERNKAAAAEKVAIQERDTAVVQRNSALVAQSRFLAKTADSFSTDGSTRAAIAIIREALPDPTEHRVRPLVDEAVSSAYRALYNNREIDRLKLPPGTLAVASDGKAGLLVFATKDHLVIRNGMENTDIKVLPHNFGPVSGLMLAPSGDRILMLGANGQIMLRDIATNNVVLRQVGEGEGTRVYFLLGGSRLLIADASQKKISLFDASSGEKLASRVFDVASGKPVTSLIEGNIIAIIADQKLRRLSTEDLGDTATFTITDAEEYAMAVSNDEKTLYVAAALKFLKGRILVLDSSTLELQREFGRISWGAKSLVKSKDQNLLALNGVSGVDFYDTGKFDYIGRVSSVPLTGGKFIKNSTYYIGYNKEGGIKQIQPDTLNEVASFLTIDGGAIEQIDALADDTGFLSISNHPSITHWAYTYGQIAKTLTIPLFIKNIDLRIAAPIHSSDFLQADNSIVAAYDFMGVSRWNLENGTSKIIRSASIKAAKKETVVTLDNGVALITSDPGTIQIYTETSGPEKPTSEVLMGFPNYIGAVAPTKVFLVTKSGEPYLLDLTSANQPVLTKLSKFSGCPRSASAFDLALCLQENDRFQGLRLSDNKMVFDIPAPPNGLSSATIASDGTALLIADKKGGLELHTAGDALPSKTWTLTTSLKGAALEKAALNNSLSKENLAAVSTGASTIETVIAADQVKISSDQATIAAALVDNTIKLINTVSNKTIDIPQHDERKIATMQFSARGQMLGVIDYAADPAYRNSKLSVYRVATGFKMFSVNLDPENVPNLFALSDGRGFGTISSRGQIVVYPAFDSSLDLVDYMRQKFPEPLTSDNRKVFFIE